MVRSSGTEDYKEAEQKLEALKGAKGLWVVDVATRFFEEHEMSDKTRKCYQTSLRNWQPFVENLTMNQITLDVVRKFVDARLKADRPNDGERIKPSTIRSDLAFMSSMFGWATMLPNGPQTNVISLFRKRTLKPSPARIRWLTQPQVRDLLAAIDTDSHRLIALVGLEAGLRKSEILTLKAHHIVPEQDGNGYYILIEGGNAKSKKGRRVPVSSTLSRTLIPHVRTLKPGAYVFPNPQVLGKEVPYKDVRPWWPDALAKAGIEDFTFHDTRHHFASWYVQRGGRLQPLMELLGHHSLAMVLKYASLGPGDSTREFRSLERT